MSSPEFFERLATNNPDGLWLLDAQGRTHYANEAMGRLLGRSPDAMSTLHVRDVLDDQGLVDFLRHINGAVQGDPGEHNVEVLLHRPDGSQLWALISWTPFIEPDGSPTTTWLHRVTEYTERRRLLDALTAREQQLSTAQTIGQLGSWELTMATGMVTGTDEYFRIYGAPTVGFVPTFEAMSAFTHPDDQETVEEALAPLMSGESETFIWEGRIRTGEGDVRWARARGFASHDDTGALVSISGTLQDITDLKESAREAHWANQQLRAHLAFTEAANQATTMGQTLEYSAANNSPDSGWQPVGLFLRDSGSDTMARGDLDIAVDARLEPEALAGLDLVLAELAWRTGQRQLEAIPWADGTGVLVAQPIAVDGVVMTVVETLIEDYDGALASPELISQIARQFENVALRAQAVHALAHARDEAMAASAMKSDFLATMSHEIRTPMNGVIGLNDLLLGTHLDHRQRQLAEGLRESGQNLLALINDILDLSKFESGMLELERREFQVRDALERGAAGQGPAAAEKGVEVTVKVDPSVPATLVGDSVRFGQILSNLCHNAVKFTDQGEVQVRLDVDELNAVDVLVRVTVTDTGIGIPPSARESIFAPFTQADLSTTRRHGGTGLGLAISQRLATALGGEIGFSDSVDQPGSSFWFTVRLGLPAQRHDHPQSTSRPRAEMANRTVLLVEDHPSAAEAVTQTLADWGVTVDHVTNTQAGAAALSTAAAQDAPYAAVLVDQTLPEGDTDRFVQDLVRLGHDGPAVVLGDPPASSLLFGGGRTVPHVSKPVRSTVLYGVLMESWGLMSPPPQPGLGRDTDSTPIGARVLIVDDHPVNQLVAAGFLEAQGCQVELADDGQQALEFLLVDDHDIDLVLMDCRMPRMDGYDATRAIRTDEAARLEHGQSGVPIVAMTASVLAGERERCLGAGMSDFLTKPVDSAELTRCLHRWIPSMGVAAGGPMGDTSPPNSPSNHEGPSGTEVPPSAASPEPVVLDPDRVAELSELVKDGVSFFERGRRSFLTRVDEMVRRIEIDAGLGDAAATMSAAHALKGSALNLGLMRLGALAGSIESAAETGDPSNDPANHPATGAVPELVGRLRQVSAEAAGALSDHARTATSPAN
ncbi:hypothetical protein GCM10027020_13360 [Nocardioides salsibiostraticola]